MWLRRKSHYTMMDWYTMNWLHAGKLSYKNKITTFLNYIPCLRHVQNQLLLISTNKYMEYLKIVLLMFSARAPSVHKDNIEECREFATCQLGFLSLSSNKFLHRPFAFFFLLFIKLYFAICLIFCTTGPLFLLYR